MHYTVYQITNQVNGKIYIGCHKTDDLNDSYMGSGTLIKRAIAKYGIDNFTKVTLAVFDSQEQMFEEEKMMISKMNPDYNIHPGGNGGFQHVNSTGANNQNKDRDAIREKVSRKLKGRTCPEHVKQALRDSHQGRDPSMYATFTGRSHSDEAKVKIGRSNSQKQSGKLNSRYGTQWITDGISSRVIDRGDPIPDGWRPGRVMRPNQKVVSLRDLSPAERDELANHLEAEFQKL